MNNTIINIEGIKVVHNIINLEHSTDTSHLLIIKDEYENKVIIEITNGKIRSNKHEQQP